MKLKPICDWGMWNWCLIPTVLVGSGGNGGWWVYIFWLRGRLSVFYA